MDNCIFCRIVQKQVPSTCVYEDDDVYVFKDLNPQAPVHVLIVPKQHVTDVAALEEEHDALAGKLLRVSALVAREMKIDKTGYRLVTNVGPHAGQGVFHLHIHLLGGRQMTWPPG
ncbi:MAG: histidine triad nucleotide-binding protein [Armatimonadota bacterium]|nr:histidine triad nucleotide-binding protein [bacterium]MDW8321316.1 histidine triad nucleotide-binding protein [Armatimonadota bacterium]